MLWLRTLVYLTPLALGLVAVLLVRQVGRLQMPPPGDAFVTAIQKPVGPLHPLGADEGVTREIRDLVFEPLLLRDESLALRPHLVDSWRFRTVATVHCASEESAGEVEAMVLSGEYSPEEGLELTGVVREGKILTFSFSSFAGNLEERFLDQIDEESLANFEVIHLTVDHSVETFFEAYLQNSVEKRELRMVDFEGDRVAELFLEGGLDRFLEELKLYLKSNADLNPRIERAGRRSHVVTREAVFALREGVHWHDGVAFSTDDVLYSFEEFTGEDSTSPLRGLFWFVDSIEATGPSEIRMVCREPPSPEFILECWERLPILPSHRFRNREKDAWAEFLDRPIGCGPYRVIRRFRDGGIELQASEGYLLGKPAQERLLYRRFDSLESKLLALRSGRIDALVPDERFEVWSHRNPGEIETLSGIPRFQHFVAWNLERKPFDEAALRVALAMGVDSQHDRVEKGGLFLGPVRGLFRSGLSYDPGPISLPPHDPRLAEERLEELGYRWDAGSGIRKAPDGEPFAFRLTVNESSSEHLALADSLVEQWAALGIQVEVERMPLERIVYERLIPRDYQGVLLSWEIPLHRDRSESFHSESVSEGRGNFFGLRDPAVDRSVEELRYASFPSEVEEAARDLQERISELQPCLFLAESGRVFWFRDGAVSLLSPGVEGGAVRPLPRDGGIARSRPWWVKRETFFPEGGIPEP